MLSCRVGEHLWAPGTRKAFTLRNSLNTHKPVIVTTTSIFAVNCIYICVGSGGKATVAPEVALSDDGD